MEPSHLQFFPVIAPYEKGMLAVDDLHTLYWEEAGNPRGPAILFLHGGPGAGCSDSSRQYFDPTFWRIILFDQRGCGRSTPLGELKDNTTEHLVDDIEKLRVARGVDRWHIFGGSWGSTLALAYGQAHPDRCLSFILRGIFTMRRTEVDWYARGIATVFPEAWRDFADLVPSAEHDDIVAAYFKRLQSGDEALRLEATKRMMTYEFTCAAMQANVEENAKLIEEKAATSMMPLMECHYMLNNLFTPDDKLLANAHLLRDIPCVIVQGRYDMICPMQTAYALHENWPKAELVIVPDAGHSSFDPPMRSALIAATEKMKAIASQQ